MRDCVCLYLCYLCFFGSFLRSRTLVDKIENRIYIYYFGSIIYMIYTYLYISFFFTLKILSLSLSLIQLLVRLLAYIRRFLSFSLSFSQSNTWVYIHYIFYLHYGYSRLHPLDYIDEQACLSSAMRPQ